MVLIGEMMLCINFDPSFPFTSKFFTSSVYFTVVFFSCSLLSFSSWIFSSLMDWKRSVLKVWDSARFFPSLLKPKSTLLSRVVVTSSRKISSRGARSSYIWQVTSFSPSLCWMRVSSVSGHPSLAIWIFWYMKLTIFCRNQRRCWRQVWVLTY